YQHPFETEAFPLDLLARVSAGAFEFMVERNEVAIQRGGSSDDLLNENERAPREESGVNILQDSQPVLDGRELDRQDTENHAGGDSRKALAQIENPALHDSGIDEAAKPSSHGLQPGAGRPQP